jgi:hypothetical protein
MHDLHQCMDAGIGASGTQRGHALLREFEQGGL